MAKKRRKRAKGGSGSIRFALLEAVAAEVAMHGREVARDSDALLVRVVAKTGLSRAEVARAAGELLPILRELMAELRRRGR